MSNKVFGLIGLGVMGKSLSRNLASKGYALALYNRHVAGKEENVATNFVAEFPNELQQAAGFDDLRAFVAALERPRRIFIMVNAGTATDAVIEELLPLLAQGDLIMDGGNAHYKDTERRTERLHAQGILCLGTGVSGGEEGALKGPAIMPGGSAEAYELAKPYLESIAARDRHSRPCCAHIGQGGAGHFVKMVHNGIEYAEMQLLAEVYYILREVFGYTPDAIADTLDAWLTTDAASYLMEITRDILRVSAGEGWLLDLVADVASSKGTGGWATAAAAELGVPATMISEALFARYLSAFAQERSDASKAIHYKNAINATNRGQFAFDPALLWAAYQLARVVNHHQGMHLVHAASEAYGWQLNLPQIARVWTNGCIIRSRLMEDLEAVLATESRILQHPVYANFVQQARPALTQVAVVALSAGLETPCLSSALQFCNGYNNPNSPMNIIQAQRDYFGAHTYTRKDTGKVVTGGFVKN